MAIRRESLERLERILRMWAMDRRVRDICESEGVSLTTVFSYLKYARETGDHRAHVRGLRPAQKPIWFLDGCVLAGEGGADFALLKQLLWPHGFVPASWRSIFSILARRCRNDGHVITCRKGAYFYGGLAVVSEVSPSVEQ